MTDAALQTRIESLGPAERIINSLTAHVDHMVHNRPGLVTADASARGGVKWTPCLWVQEGDQKVLYTVEKVGKRTVRTNRGTLRDDLKVVAPNGAIVGEYRTPGLFPEIAADLFQQVAEVFKLDNEFAARWASYAFAQDKNDLKVVLAAFMLVQDRHGQAVRADDGTVEFHDVDYRDVGEAMILHNKGLSPKHLIRVGDLLNLPQIQEICKTLGFSVSGRYEKAVTRWLRYRERNPAMLDGLVRSGQTKFVKTLARRVRYRPESPKFFQVLAWKQAANEHRSIGIGDVYEKVSFLGLSEADICARIVSEKIGYKRLTGLLPPGQELTRSMIVAMVEAGVLSDKDLILMSTTLEDFGLTSVEPVASAWKKALASAQDLRAANIARNVKTAEVKTALEDAAEQALANQIAKAVRGLTVFCMVDISSSMTNAIAQAKAYLTRFLGGFPLDQLHVSVFNTSGRAVKIPAASKAGVDAAFRGISAGGGTLYAAGLTPFRGINVPAENDVLFLIVGDSEGETGEQFATSIERSGLHPSAIGFLKVVSPAWGWGSGRGITVESAASSLGIPLFSIDEKMFEGSDPYAIPQMLRDLIASTPVTQGTTVARKRVSLVETILNTELLAKPLWAQAA